MLEVKKGLAQVFVGAAPVYFYTGYPTLRQRQRVSQKLVQRVLAFVCFGFVFVCFCCIFKGIVEKIGANVFAVIASL